MFLRFVVKLSLILSLLATTAFSYAANDDKIRCPSINKIQQTAQQINSISKSNGYYSVFALLPVFQENGLLWFVIMDKISAQSYDEAIMLGKDAVQKTSARNQDYAEKGSWGALSGDICTYGIGEIYALGVHMNLSG